MKLLRDNLMLKFFVQQVCNNNGNCHCKQGYACPYCELAGPGGSFDSGQGCQVMMDVGRFWIISFEYLIFILNVVKRSYIAVDKCSLYYSRNIT